jgi:ribonuclease BN (tRNA processing enzyme)
MRQLAFLLTLGLSALPVSGYAQSVPGDSGTRVFTIGTGGGPSPRATRAQSANMLTVNGKYYIVDAGDGTTRRLAEMKVPLRQIGTIFITHGHNDHTGGLGYLLDAAWTAQRTEPIHVYGPPTTEALVKAAVQYFSFDAAIRISDGTRSVPIEKVFFGHDVLPGTVYNDGNVKVTAVENSHFHFKPGSPANGITNSYAYRFETSDRVVVFTGDTGPSEAVTTLAQDADLLVSEVGSPDDVMEFRKRSGQWDLMSESEKRDFIRHQVEEHLTPEAVGQMATKARVKAVVLTHLLPRPGTEDYEPFADEVRRHFSGPVSIANDLASF